MAIPAGTYKARLTFRLGDPEVEQAVFGFHLRSADTAGQATTDALTTHVDTAWTDNADDLKQFMGTSTSLAEVAVYELDSTGHAAHRGLISHPASGTGSWVGTATGSLPWECAPVVSLHAFDTGSFSADAARKRGRMYMPPYASGKITNPDGIMNNADVDTYQEAVQAFLEQVNGIPTGLSHQARVVILSAGARVRRLKGAPLGALLDPIVTDVIDVLMGSTIHSQRRREKSQIVNHVKLGTLTP